MSDTWGGFKKEPAYTGGNTVIAGKRAAVKEGTNDASHKNSTPDLKTTSLLIPFKDHNRRLQYLMDCKDFLVNMLATVEDAILNERDEQ